ncbi:unnamed protein product, partial [marine sediment metagenome]
NAPATGPVSINVSNQGGAPLTITGLSLTGADAAHFSFSGTVPTVLPVGASSTIDVYFDPQSGGAKSANLVIATDHWKIPSIQVELEGIGLEVIYVDQDALFGGDGFSWSTARQRIGEGILSALAFGVPQVWVAEGMYLEMLSLPDNVAVYGGFAGNESTFAMRDLAAHPVIINGSQADDGSPADHVIVMNAVTGSILDGFTITGGLADGIGADASGGGIYCVDLNPSNTIANCTIADNATSGLSSAGGGLYLSNSDLSIANCKVVGNSSPFAGGLYIENS